MQRESSMSEALERTVEAGQSLIVRRMELLVAEMRTLLHDSGMLLLATAFALFGWVYLMRAATVALSEHFPRIAVELAVGVPHLCAAFLIFMLSSRRRVG
jgi:hypothetical protein